MLSCFHIFSNEYNSQFTTVCYFPLCHICVLRTVAKIMGVKKLLGKLNLQTEQFTSHRDAVTVVSCQTEKGGCAGDVIIFSDHLLSLLLCAQKYAVELFQRHYTMNTFKSVWECTSPPGIQVLETIKPSYFTGKMQKADGGFFGPCILMSRDELVSGRSREDKGEVVAGGGR